MSYLIHILLGIGIAYIGLLPPGMLNMTTVKTALHQGRTVAYRFALGASMIVFMQASVAAIFAKVLNEQPQIVHTLGRFAAYVLLFLAIFFFYEARKRREFKAAQQVKKGKAIAKGMFMSSINMLAVPFFLTWASWLEYKGWVTLDILHSLCYAGGASLGAYLLFVTYTVAAKFVQSKAGWLASNINYVLAALFVVLSITAFNKYGF